MLYFRWVLWLSWDPIIFMPDFADISWHRDKPSAEHWPLPNYRVIKVLMNFWDVPADGGATAVVPGSHRLQEGPQQTLAGRFFDGGERGVAKLPHTAMPNQVTVAAAPGTALLFDTSICK